MTKRAIVKGAVMALATAGWGLVFYDAVPLVWQANKITAICVGVAVVSTVIRGWAITLKELDT